MGTGLAAFVLDIVVFGGIYITLTPLLRAITKSDVDLLELTLSEPAIVGRIASPLLRYERLMVGLGTRDRQQKG